MAQCKVVNLKNLPVQSWEEIASKIKEYKTLLTKFDENHKLIQEIQERNAPIARDMTMIFTKLRVYSVSVKHINKDTMFSDEMQAKILYQQLIEAGIPKTDVVVEYTDEGICSNISNVDNNDFLTQKHVDLIYSEWSMEIAKKSFKKTKWDYAADN